MPIAVIDVDGTVVDTFSKWNAWAVEKFGTGIFSPVCKSVELPSEDFLDFWKQRDLYDDLEPMEGSVEAIEALRNKGFEIVFASSCFQEHTGSKKDFLLRFFPEHDFVATSNKNELVCDLFVDDYNHYLHQARGANPGAAIVKINNGINTKNDEFYFMDWAGIALNFA